MKNKYQDIEASIKGSVDDPSFFAEAFHYAVKKRRENQKLDSDNLRRVCSEEYEGLSRRIDTLAIQEGCTVRNVLRTRRLANLLIDDNGKIDTVSLNKIIDHLREHLYLLGPGTHHDSLRQEHLLATLEKLRVDKGLAGILHTINKPHMHPFADQLIVETLQLPEGTALTNAHARRAALSALFCYLRQALGSCFATAPAIIVHDEQPEAFLTDIKELFESGQLKRTIAGDEYSVPLTASWGVGDLKRPFLLPADPVAGAELLSSQPGLVAALEIEGLIDADARQVEKMSKLKRLVFEVLKEREGSEYQVIVTAEEIIGRVLLRHLSLTEKDLVEYESRPRAMIHGALMMQMPKGGGGMGGKGELCLRYFNLFDRAKSAFKSLSENALLRAWEYTLASFAETKAQFAKWNFYSSLGLRPEDKGGIGNRLYEILKFKLDFFNRKVEDHQFEYEQMFQQVKILEGRLSRAESEEEARWLKIDYRVKTNELQVIVEMRDRAHFNAKRVAGLFDLLIDFYIDLFPQYFQEVYDPEMVDVNVGLYDDSPAGFRLLYKHGRANTAQWTLIRTAQQFIESLVSFFNAAERQMTGHDAFKGLDQLLTEVTSEVVSHLRTNIFLESAFYRMAAVHKSPIVKDPLNNMDKVDKKPWVYTSGGNLETLVSVYFRREQKPTSASRWVESPVELLVFLVDTLKQIPYAVMEKFLANRKMSMIMYSPTHAFLLKPGFEMLARAWQRQEFTYTWVRDKLLFPMERANEEIVLNSDAMHYLCKMLQEKVPENFRFYFKQSFGELKGSMSPPVWRDYLLYTMEKDRGLQFRGKPILEASDIDSLLFAELPLFPTYKLKERVERIFGLLPGLSKEITKEALKILEHFTPSVLGEPVMGALRLQNVTKALLCLAAGRTSFSLDYHKLIKNICVQEGFSLPMPIHFADSNWVKEEFAFLVNPGNGKLELWRVDSLGLQGTPMAEWSHWLDGSRKHPDWGVYTQPNEYIAAIRFFR